jgi:hypothetical protein
MVRVMWFMASRVGTSLLTFCQMFKSRDRIHRAEEEPSKLITDADRIFYMVSDDRIDFPQARYHYSDR